MAQIINCTEVLKGTKYKLNSRRKKSEYTNIN